MSPTQNKWMLARCFALAILALAFLCSSGCRKRDIRKISISVPAMTNDAAAAIVVGSLSHFGPAVPKIDPDISQGRLIVVYDSMILARKNLEYAIAQAGFDADETKAFDLKNKERAKGP